MYAHKVLTSVSLNDEDLAESKVGDDGCGCCARNLEKHEILTLENAIEDMKELVEKGEKVLEARKKLFEKVGEILSRSDRKEVEPECVSCESSYNAFFDNDYYLIEDEYFCKSCVKDNPDLYRNRGKVFKEVDSE